MKVLFVNPLGELGGAERSLLDLAWSLRQADPSLKLELLSLARGPLTAAARELGVKVHELPLPGPLQELGENESIRGMALGAALGAPSAIAFGARFRRVLRDAAPEIIHSNGLKAHVLTAAVRPSGLSLVWHMRDFLSVRPVMRRLLPLLGRRADAVIAVSEAVGRDIRPLLPSLSVHVVLNGIRTECFRRATVEPLDLDKLSGLPTSPAGIVRIGMVATYAHWKGHEVFLEAASRIEAPNARFYVIGGALYSSRGSQLDEAALRQRAKMLGLQDRCGLVSFRDDPARAYAALDIVVHASTRPEPFGRTVAEAMASGCAVVAAAAGGPMEQIRSGEDGLLVEPNDVSRLSQALAHLIANAPVRKRLAVQAQVRAARDLDAARLGAQVRAIYDALLEQR